MAGFVLYDSFLHQTSLYYIGFYFADIFLGRIFLLTQRVEYQDGFDQFSLSSSRWNLALVVFLIAFRFIMGKYLLQTFHVVWVSDTLYLFFIGLYQARWKGLVRQIDELIYGWLKSEKG